jgi:hypothetical protein
MTELPDRLLRGALHDTASTAPSQTCVDAEALAAWAEGTMSGAARAAFEDHAADCARCQALMAAMARTEPPPVERPWTRRALFSWLMPLAAAAAAIVVVSLAIAQRREPAFPAALPASTAATASRAEDRAASRAVPSTPAPGAPDAPAPAIPDQRRDRTMARTVQPRDEQKAEQKDERKDVAARPAPKAEPRAQDAAPAAAPQPVPGPPPAPSAAPPPAAAKAFAAPAPPAAREVAAPAPAAAGAIAGAASPSTRAADRDEARLKVMAATAAAVVIASPARESQWRILNGAVDHTNDGGATWQAQSIGTDVPVRAGAAPAARVCWLAGAGGLVLLTTDGSRWRRIDFPDPVDLIAIEATDASHATVTTATGRRLSTSDAGASWIRQ